MALVQAADGYPDSVKELIEAGANVNGMPLIMAIQCDEAEIVRLLIAAGSAINVVYRETTPLIRAVTSCRPQIVQILIEAGADVHLKDPQGRTPLQAFVEGPTRLNVSKAEKDKIMEILKSAGANDLPPHNTAH